MVTRRVVLGGAAVALGAPLVALASKVFAAPNMPLTVVNSTGRYANSAITMYIVGTNLATGQQAYVNRSGALIPVSSGLNGPDGFADLSIPLAAGGNTTINLPNMSGRVYFAIGQKLRFKLVTDGAGRPALQYPAGWVSTDPNYAVLHDCMEFTFNGVGMFCNTTMVDMFSIPMSIRLTGSRTQSTGTLTSGARDRIFSELAALTAYRSLIIGNNLRVIAPGHGINSGRFSPTYFDPYINEVWARYAGTSLTVRTNAGTFTGRIQGGQLVFNNGVRAFAKPTTRDVFFCDGALAAPNDGISGPVAAILGAAFNRATLRDHTPQPTTSASTFYQQPISNHYSRVMHANSADGKAYGFAFDDVVDFASYIQDTSPTSITLTLTPFGSATPSPDPTPTATATGGVISAYSTIQAENYVAQSGVSTESTSDTGGGRNLSRLANGDWVQFSNVDFGSAPATQFVARVASGAAGGVSGLVEVRLGSRSSAPIGSFAVANTGGWQSWRTVPANIAGATGLQTVYVTFTSGQPADFVNLNWFTFRR
jgi:hypothetical protein